MESPNESPDSPLESPIPPITPDETADFLASGSSSSRPSSSSTATAATQPPSLRPLPDTSSSVRYGSSRPLAPVAAARGGPQPPPLTSRPSGLNSDMAAKMAAFAASRPPRAGGPPAGAAGGPISQNGLVGGMANLKLPQTAPRPAGPGGWASSTATPMKGGFAPGAMQPKMGSLAAKRGMNRGMKLSDATGPAPAAAPSATDGPKPAAENKTESMFSKYSEFVDTKAGTLNFKNKAVIHGGGIDFSSGTNFSISLDEVDTLDELGKGNYGTVYKVRHSRPQMRKPGQGLGGIVSRPTVQHSPSAPIISQSHTTGAIMAMKEIRLELDEAKFAAIIMELDILHRCVSPFIIDFYGAFFQEGAVYICIEFMDGGSIDKLYGDGVPEGVLRKITLSTVMGLKSLKDEHNIIHRDVKPTNILVNTRGQVKICDFGVSGNLVASIAKTNIGCQSYMAPERIAGGGVAQAGANPGGGTYSVQSDIWSLGLTVIECALGRYPYPPETYNNIFSQLSAIVDGDPPDLPAEGFSDSARDFVHGCLNKIPGKRPTYAMLLRHAWLSPLLKPPTISEDEEEEAAADTNGNDNNGEILPATADKEVAAWVQQAIERRRSGQMKGVEKPALHAAPLDAVKTNSPAKEVSADEVLGVKDGDAPAEAAAEAPAATE